LENLWHNKHYFLKTSQNEPVCQPVYSASSLRLIEGKTMIKQNHRELLEQKKNAMAAAGLVAERFPDVSSIVLQMTYYQKTADPILMKRTVSFYPTTYACFHMDCMREECVNGGFDLAPVVAGLVKKRKKAVSGKIVCNGKNDGLRAGHASIAYEVSIQYSKRAR
jgi:hypothetical protein